MDTLENALITCNKYNLCVTAKETVFYTKHENWCCRDIDKNRYRLDPRDTKVI